MLLCKDLLKTFCLPTGKRESTDYARKISQHSAQQSGPASQRMYYCSTGVWCVSLLCLLVACCEH